MQLLLHITRLGCLLAILGLAPEARGKITATASGLGGSFSVESFGLGVDRMLNLTPGTTPINIGVGNLREIHFSKRLDKSSAWLFDHAVQGLSAGSIEFMFEDSGTPGGGPYLIIGVEAVQVRSWTTTTDADELPAEEVTLRYHRVYVETFNKVNEVYISDGVFGWDLDKNVAWVPASVTEPTAVDDRATVAEDTEVILDVLANDLRPAGESLIIGGTTLPDQGGTVEIDANQKFLRYAPAENFFGEEVFIYRLERGGPGTVRITVRAVNDLPVAQPDQLGINSSSRHIIHSSYLVANDLDVEGDPLTASTIDPESLLGGLVELRGDWIVYTPPDGFLAGQTDSFNYWVTDGQTSGQGDPANQTGTLTIALQRSPNVQIIRSLTTPLVSEDSVQVQIRGVPGTTYSIEEIPELGSQSSWSVLGEVTTDENGDAEFSQPTSQNAGQRYFRSVPVFNGVP